MTGVQHKIVGAGAGIAAAYVMTVGYGDTNGILIAGTSLIGCMLPDIDHNSSKIGRKRKAVTGTVSTLYSVGIKVLIVLALGLAVLTGMGMVAYGVNSTHLIIVAALAIGVLILTKCVGDSSLFRWATKHRGLMHTLVVPAILVYALTISSAPVFRMGITGLIVGYCSHLFADMLTVDGCPILFPLTRSNLRFPTHLVTSHSSCTVAAYIVCVLEIVAGIFITHNIL